MYVHLQNPASCKRPTSPSDVRRWPHTSLLWLPSQSFHRLCRKTSAAWFYYPAEDTTDGLCVSQSCQAGCGLLNALFVGTWEQRQRVACLTKRLWMQSEPSFQMEKGPLAAARRFPSLGCPTNLTTQIAPRHCSWWQADLVLTCPYPCKLCCEIFIHLEISI